MSKQPQEPNKPRWWKWAAAVVTGIVQAVVRYLLDRFMGSGPS
ncbi:hypothetical protein [Nocardiopsis ganjiahuensis]|nr:hypothetical protein [Nocardiopsis ganjiahuensis]